MPTNWSPGYLEGAVDKSLRRLKRDRVDILMLHSPDAETIRQGPAIETLERARAKGKIGRIGISIDTPEAAEAALADGRVGALQVPVHPGATEFSEVLSRADAQGVILIAREIFGGVGAVHLNAGEDRARCIRSLADDRRITVSLVGTTKVNHLLEAVRNLSSQASPT
jgi:aryl-alcohol dehydrogenase-like predicted oxidoreductase